MPYQRECGCTRGEECSECRLPRTPMEAENRRLRAENDRLREALKNLWNQIRGFLHGVNSMRSLLEGVNKAGAVLSDSDRQEGDRILSMPAISGGDHQQEQVVDPLKEAGRQARKALEPLWRALGDHEQEHP